MKFVVHCDSIPDASIDKHVFNIISDYIGKCCVLNKAEDDRSNWTYLPLHMYGLQKQTDSYSCGIFTCVNAHCLVVLKDYSIRQIDLPRLRYWVGKSSIEEYETHRKRGTTVWEDTEIENKVVTQSSWLRLENTPLPFAALRNFMMQQTNSNINHNQDPKEGECDIDLQALFFGITRRKVKKLH